MLITFFVVAITTSFMFTTINTHKPIRQDNIKKHTNETNSGIKKSEPKILMVTYKAEIQSNGSKKLLLF